MWMDDNEIHFLLITFIIVIYISYLEGFGRNHSGHQVITNQQWPLHSFFEQPGLVLYLIPTHSSCSEKVIHYGTCLNLGCY